jgi:hypothetical protein
MSEIDRDRLLQFIATSPVDRYTLSTNIVDGAMHLHKMCKLARLLGGPHSLFSEEETTILRAEAYVEQVIHSLADIAKRAVHQAGGR